MLSNVFVVRRANTGDVLTRYNEREVKMKMRYKLHDVAEPAQLGP